MTLLQYGNVTERRTDRQTDWRTTMHVAATKTTLCRASRG